MPLLRTRGVLAAFTLACTLAAGTALAQPRQLLASANDAKVRLVNGVVTPQAADNQDSVTLYDIAQSPARLLARVDVPSTSRPTAAGPWWATSAAARAVMRTPSR